MTPDNDTSKSLPADLWNRVGDVTYYRARNDDFIRRNPGRTPPDYYLEYGDKYAHRFTDDLLVRFSIVVILVAARRSEYVRERPLHCDPANASAAEDGAIYVKKNDSHRRVRKSPLMIVAVPIPCQTVGASWRNSQATAIAITG